MYQDKQTVAVSYQPDNLVKIRFFGVTNGVLLDEWAETIPGATHATEYGGKVYVIDTSSSLPSVAVTVLNGETVTNHKYKLGNSEIKNVVFDVTGQYLICAQGKLVTVINLKDGSSRSVTEEGEVTSITTSGPGIVIYNYHIVFNVYPLEFGQFLNGA